MHRIFVGLGFFLFRRAAHLESTALHLYQVKCDILHGNADAAVAPPYVARLRKALVYDGGFALCNIHSRLIVEVTLFLDNHFVLAGNQFGESQRCLAYRYVVDVHLGPSGDGLHVNCTQAANVRCGFLDVQLHHIRLGLLDRHAEVIVANLFVAWV